MEKNRILTENLAVGYGKTPLIREISLRVRPGEIVTLIGPNGAGKSTILKSIIGQLERMGGTVRLVGKDMAGMKEREIARHLSVMMTERIRPELMTCKEVVSMGRYPYTGPLGVLGREDRERVEEALSLVRAEELADCDFGCISDGQRQRILLARAICQEPEVLVLDEPTSFLDIRHKLELLEILKELVRKKGLAVLMSLHELDLAQKVSDYMVCVKGDRIAACGLPEEIFTTDRIRTLFDITCGTYCPRLGCVELAAPEGQPQVFVIGGNGSGIPVYRRLQKQGIPFAAGVLHENDIDCPVASALSAHVITERPFEPVSETQFRRAAALMADCREVVCCIGTFGPMNEKNRELAKLGGRKTVFLSDGDCAGI